MLLKYWYDLSDVVESSIPGTDSEVIIWTVPLMDSDDEFAGQLTVSTSSITAPEEELGTPDHQLSTVGFALGNEYYIDRYVYGQMYRKVYNSEDQSLFGRAKKAKAAGAKAVGAKASKSRAARSAHLSDAIKLKGAITGGTGEQAPYTGAFTFYLSEDEEEEYGYVHINLYKSGVCCLEEPVQYHR